MNHIKLLRIKAAIDLNTAAEKLGIKRTTLQRIEQGVRRPSVKVALKMTVLYECTLEKIYKPYNYD